MLLIKECLSILNSYEIVALTQEEMLHQICQFHTHRIIDNDYVY